MMRGFSLGYQIVRCLHFAQGGRNSSDPVLRQDFLRYQPCPLSKLFPATQSVCDMSFTVQGGRNANDPVLREDVFLLKVKALGRRAAKKKKPAAADGDADGAAADGSVDPFAPEFSADTWHVQSQAELAQHRGLAAVLQPAWKNNPNERKLTRSNRRG
jgi:hypothetical protein